MSVVVLSQKVDLIETFSGFRSLFEDFNGILYQLESHLCREGKRRVKAIHSERYRFSF